MKAAKAALSQAKELRTLRREVKRLRKVWKADKSNADAKRALKEAKQKLASAKASSAAAEETPAQETKKQATPAPTKEESSPSVAGKKRPRPGTAAGIAASSSQEPAGVKAKRAKGAKGASDTKGSDTKQDAAEDKRPRKIFVSNLNFRVSEEAIRALFSPCGDITEVTWLEDKNGAFQGCAFVTFADESGADRAIRRGGQRHMGRDVRVEASRDTTRPKDAIAPDATSCFIGNLPFDTTADAVHKFAGGADAGVMRVHLLKDKQTGSLRGCGFVDFKSNADLANFVARNGETFAGRKVRLRPKS